MPKSKTEKLRALASKRQVVRAKDATEMAFPEPTFHVWRAGDTWKRSRAVFILRGTSLQPSMLRSSEQAFFPKPYVRFHTRSFIGRPSLILISFLAFLLIGVFLAALVRL